MSRTLNGWKVRQHPGKGTFVAPNGKTVYCADDDVATVFGYIVQQWHNRIEKLPKATYNTYPNERKGYIVVHCSRPAPLNGLKDSNHLSHTAFDVLGDKHHYERSCTMANGNSCWGDGRPHKYISGFTKAQETQLRAIAAEVNKAAGKVIIRLGIDFGVGWRDAMHVELAPGTTNADVALAAKVLKAADIVQDLTHIYSMLKSLDYSTTKSGIVEYQKERGLVPDGIAGSKTQSALEEDMGTLQEIKSMLEALPRSVWTFGLDPRGQFDRNDPNFVQPYAATHLRYTATSSDIARVEKALSELNGHEVDVKALAELLSDDIADSVAKAVSDLELPGTIDVQEIAKATTDHLAKRMAPTTS